MEKAVNEEMSHSKRLRIRKINEYFAGMRREREAQHVGDFIFATIDAIESAREKIAAENEGEFILFPHNMILYFLEIDPRDSLPCCIGN